MGPVHRPCVRSALLAEATIATPYLTIERATWAPLASWEMPPLTPIEVADLEGVNGALSVDEVDQVYLSLIHI